MKKIIALCLLLVVTHAYSGAQTANTAVKIDFSVSGKTLNNLYVYAFEGTAGLPDGAVLDCSCVFIKKVLHPNASVPPGENDFQELTIPVAEGKAAVKNGSFKLLFGYLKKKPYSGKYVYAVSFDRKVQPAAVLERLGNMADMVVPCEKTVITGTEEDFEKERKEEEQRIISDFSQAESVLKELMDKFKTAYTTVPVDISDWNAWLKNWQEKVDAIAKNNSARFEEDYNFQEADARYYMGNMLEGIEDLKKLYTDNLSTEPTKRLPYMELDSEARELQAALNRSRESLMLTKRLDNEKLLGLAGELINIVNVLITEKSRAESGASTETSWQEVRDAAVRAFSKTVTTIQSECENQVPLTVFAGIIRNFNALNDEYNSIVVKKKSADETTKKLEDAFRNSVESLKQKFVR